MSSGESVGFEVRKADWVDVHTARARTLAGAAPVETESVALDQALGRALAEQVVAEATLPPWDNSAMDGYAVRAADVIGASRADPIQLMVSGVVRAGDRARPTLRPGEAIRIMTGAPIPAGADSVVRVEDTDREARPGTVCIQGDRDRGRHIRAAGQDMRASTVLLDVGQAVTPGVVGVLAAAGRTYVTVRRRPRVAILSTGDELREPDRYDDVRAGLGIPESNGPMLAAMTRAVEGEPVSLGIAADDPEELRARILDGSGADVLVTIGGASMGEADLVKRVLDGIGFDLDFWRVKMRPGSPISFGWLEVEGRRQAVFGLPGNPSSAYVTFEVFVRPFLLRLAGHDRVHRRVVPCQATERFDTPARLTHFQRVSVDSEDGRLTASLTGSQISGLVTGLAHATGLAIVEEERASVEPGETVDVMLLDTGPGALGDDSA